MALSTQPGELQLDLELLPTLQPGFCSSDAIHSPCFSTESWNECQHFSGSLMVQSGLHYNVVKSVTGKGTTDEGGGRVQHGQNFLFHWYFNE